MALHPFELALVLGDERTRQRAIAVERGRASTPAPGSQLERDLGTRVDHGLQADRRGVDELRERRVKPMRPHGALTSPSPNALLLGASLLAAAGAADRGLKAPDATSRVSAVARSAQSAPSQSSP